MPRSTLAASETITKDDFLGGKVKVLQPKNGYRAGGDAVLLAASVEAKSGQIEAKSDRFEAKCGRLEDKSC